MKAAFASSDKNEVFAVMSNESPDICLDISPLEVDNGVHRLGSVWEVLESCAWPLVNYTSALTEMQEDLKARLQSVLRTYNSAEAQIRQQDRDNVAILIDNFSPWLKSHELTASLDCLNRIKEEYAEDAPSIRGIISHIELFHEILEDELRRRIFLFVVPQDGNLYNRPLASFPLTWPNYPSARDDIEEACRCYALGRYTACVFHCMAILQCGLYALATELGVMLRYPVELAEWCEIIAAIEKKVAAMVNRPRSAARDERMTFHSECAVQFRYFKDAWRNHVAHMRETYDRDQAHSILLHVRDFMEKLSTRVPEARSS